MRKVGSRTLYLEISSSTSYLRRSPYLFLYPRASSRNLSLKSFTLKISEIRIPLRAAAVEYAGCENSESVLLYQERKGVLDRVHESQDSSYSAEMLKEEKIWSQNS
jgi:hypothetical protein